MQHCARRAQARFIGAMLATVVGAGVLLHINPSAYADVATPIGPSGSWVSDFDDEFNGSALNTQNWSAMDGDHMNNVTTHASNVAVTGGDLVLTLASSNSGAYVSTDKNSGAGVGYGLAVGDYAEARVSFPGDGSSIYNWPAWWASGPNWPTAGENDIAEGLGTLTVNYHSPSGAHNQGTIPGTWSNQFHTYGVYRSANHSDVYWDGKLVKSYATDDDGQPQSLLINVGNSNTAVYGQGSQVKVDWVRAWKPGAAAAATTTTTAPTTTSTTAPKATTTTSTTTPPPVVTVPTTPVTAAPMPHNPVSVPFRMDAGSATSHTDASGQTWQPDQYAYGKSSQYTGAGGQIHLVTNTIAGTNDQTLFQSERWGMTGYKIPVANGTYDVVLDFAELSPVVSNGERTQTITANGQVIVNAVNAQSEVGAYTADIKHSTVTVTNGVLDLGFSSANEPSLNGLEILPAARVGSTASTTSTTSPVPTTVPDATSTSVAPDPAVRTFMRRFHHWRFHL